jgi:putative NADPH-quinone reductase
MSTILLISGHPDISRSQANRLIVEAFVGQEAITTVDLMLNYPNLHFDISAEQQLLRNAGLIIIQSPVYWYGLPAHVRLWMERVFSYGFAHGPEGNQLQGKSFLLSLTLGGTAEAYTEKGKHMHSVEYFLEPLRLLAEYCGMNYLNPVYSNNMSIDATGQEFKQLVADHVSRLNTSIRQWMMSQYKEKPIMELI